MILKLCEKCHAANLDDRARCWRCDGSFAAPAGSVAEQCWAIVEELREPEGSAVIIICPNPDFNGLPDQAIEVCADWTGWQDKRFAGDTVLECLLAAQAECRRFHPPNAEVSEGGTRDSRIETAAQSRPSLH